MPEITDMAQWYIELKQSQLQELLEQKNILDDNIESLQKHISVCQSELAVQLGKASRLDLEK